MLQSFSQEYLTIVKGHLLTSQDQLILILAIMSTCHQINQEKNKGNSETV